MTPTPDSPATTLLRGRYERLELVGAGTQGAVWRAHDHQHDRVVALKGRLVGPSVTREQLLSEARVLLEIEPHRHLPLAREDFFDSDHHWLVMDWVDGPDLTACTPSYEELVVYLRQIASALDHLHGHQPPVVHGDVKPANIVVQGDRAVLVDFGLAQTLGVTAVGSAAFMAPEVAAGHPAGPASDRFSFAATAYRLLEGVAPEPGRSLLLDLVPPAHRPPMPAAFAAGLALDPAVRPPTADHFVTMLTTAARPGHGFFGRAEELATLRSLVTGGEDEIPFAAVVEGEAGIGKSRLIEEAVADAAGLAVLRAKGSELETDRPFGPLLDALREHDDGLDGLVGRANRHAVIDHIVGVVESMTTATPMLLVVDDLQWVDDATLVTLGRLVRRRDVLGVSVLCACRPGDRSPTLDAMLRGMAADGATSLVLSPLTDDTVAALVADRIGGTPGSNLLARVRGAAGNPLVVGEFVRSVIDRLHTADGVVDIDDVKLPLSLQRSVLQRLATFDDETNRLLEIAAVLGASFDVATLASIAEREPQDAARALQPLVDAGLLAVDPEGVRFRHDLIHEAITDNIPALRRQSLHVATARHLIAAGAEAVLIAQHLDLGTTGPDAEASDWLWAAGAAALMLDYRASSNLLSRAIARTPQSHPDLQGRRFSWAAIAVRNPDPRHAEAAYKMLDEPRPPSQRWLLQFAVVVRAAMAGELERMDALAFAEPRPPAAQSLIASIVGGLCAVRGDVAGAHRRVAELLAHTIDSPDEEALLIRMWTSLDEEDGRKGLDANFAASAAVIAWIQGDSEGAASHIAIWDAVAGSLDLPPASGDGVGVLVMSEVGDGDWRRLVRRTEKFVAFYSQPDIESTAAFATWLTGDWDAALVHAANTLRLSEESGVVWSSHLAYGVAALIEVNRGHTDAARHWIDQCEHLVPDFSLSRWAEAVASGNPPTETWDADAEAGRRMWQKLYAPDVLRAAVEHEDAERAAEVIDFVRSLGGAAAAPLTRWCIGLADGDAPALLDAAEGYRKFERPVEAARATEDAAAVLAASDRDGARSLFEDARRAFAAVDSQRDLARLDQRMRNAGVRTGRARSTRRPATGWASLTKAELRVVELVAESSSYGDIGQRLAISPRTVEAHVAHVFTKLGLRSKAQLAAAYAERTTRAGPG